MAELSDEKRAALRMLTVSARGYSLPTLAARYLIDGTPSIAILDINLGDRNSVPIADRLVNLGTPFFFAIGYGEQASLPVEHRNRPVVQKSYTLENIATALAEVLGYSRLN
jgi:hypothetical protein